MIPVVVQCPGKKTLASGTTDSLSFASPVTPGNHVIVLIASFAGTTAGVASAGDNQGNAAYTVEDAKVTTESAAIAYGKAVAAAGTFTVTINFDNTSGADWTIMEVANLDPASIRDTGAAQYSPFSDPVVVTAAAPNVQANELVVAVAKTFTDSITGTPTTGYTDAFTDSATTGGRGSYKIVSSVETSSASFPFAAAGNAVALLLTFKAAADATAVLHPQICLG